MYTKYRNIFSGAINVKQNIYNNIKKVNKIIIYIKSLV